MICSELIHWSDNVLSENGYALDNSHEFYVSLLSVPRRLVDIDVHFTARQKFACLCSLSLMILIHLNICMEYNLFVHSSHSHMCHLVVEQQPNDEHKTQQIDTLPKLWNSNTFNFFKGLECKKMFHFAPCEKRCWRNRYLNVRVSFLSLMNVFS